MSTPYPLEDRQQLDTSITPMYDPWHGPANPSFFAGMGFNDETAELGPMYRALEAAGSGAAKGEALLAGVFQGPLAAAAKYSSGIWPQLSQGLTEAAGGMDTIQQDAQMRVAAMTPNPETTGAAVQILHGVGESATLAALGGVAGIPGAVGMLGGAEGLSRYQQLSASGVDPETAAMSAAVTGVTTGASLLLPASMGVGLITRLLSGASVQGGFGLVNRYADHKILEAGGYPEMAAQQRVWDGQQILTDLVLGSLFGAAHRPEGAPSARAIDNLRNRPGVEDAALTSSLAGADRLNAPGVPVDPAAANAHVAALQAAMADVIQGKPVDVSASGVAGETFLARRDPDLSTAERAVIDSFHDAGLLDANEAVSQLEAAMGKRLGIEPTVEQASTPQAPNPADLIPRATEGTLSPAARAIETRFADEIGANPAAVIAAYEAHPETEGGRIINTDIARELSPDYLADRTQSAAVHEPASWLVKQVYAKRLAESAGPGHEPVALFTAGGTGAGKSTAIKSTLETAAGPKPQVVYDSNLNNAASGIKKIDQALAVGKKARVVLVDREPTDALVAGALPRAMRQEAEFGSGRTVPIEEHIRTHIGANEAIRQIAEHYAGNPNVEVKVIDNSHGPGNARVIDLADLRKLDYNQTREKVLKALDQELQAGRISQSVYRGFAGTAGRAGGEPGPGREPAAGSAGTAGLLERARAFLGGSPGGEPERERAGASAGQLTQRVATATGRNIDVAPRLIEARDLITSDQRGYPQELQPRARGDRKALDAQVTDIAKNLAPERLGVSAEADRGAPITGEGNVVESGNGRVMALRQVYKDAGEKADAYRRFLEAQGYDLTGYSQPVMVRERVTPMTMDERRAFALEANQAATAELSPVERAQADARAMDSATMAKLAGADLTTGQNADFVRAFIESLPQSEHSAMLNPDGTVSQAGVRRIQAAILAKAYGGTRESNVTLGRILEGTSQDLKSTLNALIDAAPAYARLRQMIDDGVIGKEYDIAPAIVQAVEDVARLRATGGTLAEHLATSDMFSSKTLATRAFYDPTGTRLVGRDQAAAALMKYADSAMAQRLNQGSLFSDTPAAPERLLEAVQARTQDMFGLRTEQGGKVKTPGKTGVMPGEKPAPAERAASEAAKRDMAVPDVMPERVLQQAMASRPNLEIVSDSGTPMRAAAALEAANSEVEAMQERAAPAVEAAMDCFARVGT